MLLIVKAQVTKAKRNERDYIKLKTTEKNQQTKKATYRMEENVCKSCI